MINFINSPKIKNIFNIDSQNSIKKTNSAQKSASQDSVQISEQSVVLQQRLNAIRNSQIQSDEIKIEMLQKQIDSKTYAINADKIADSIISTMKNIK